MNRFFLMVLVVALSLAGCANSLSRKNFENIGEAAKQDEYFTVIWLSTINVFVAGLIDIFTFGGALTPEESEEVWTQAAQANNIPLHTPSNYHNSSNTMQAEEVSNTPAQYAPTNTIYQGETNAGGGQPARSYHNGSNTMQAGEVSNTPAQHAPTSTTYQGGTNAGGSLPAGGMQNDSSVGCSSDFESSIIADYNREMNSPTVTNAPLDQNQCVLARVHLRLYQRLLPYAQRCKTGSVSSIQSAIADMQRQQREGCSLGK
ncbi:hypothetical protein [Azotobacter chroococcum]|uniref:hypothetical protein n=1 Tax=Azotobacter chroococcum TaxID=353 RepID=UPI0010AEC605|nr:hypothetical protein [Azotobacter chroococcum]TKD44858.1 hypothetical protein FCG41_05335 [Azotobacter chroococcum]